LRVGSENMENLMTVVDRLDELQASSVGRRECSSTRQRTGARRMDVHVDAYSQSCHRRRAVATAQAHVMEVSQGSGVCAALCIRRTLCRHVMIGTTIIILLFDCLLTVLTVIDDWYTAGTVLVDMTIGTPIVIFAVLTVLSFDCF